MKSNKPLVEFQTALTGEDSEQRALPFSSYRSESVAALEAQKVFAEQWVFVCAEASLAETGNYYAINIAGESVVLIRGKDGKLRALSNVCRHRGTPILDEGRGDKARLVCPYHAWTYSDTGELKGVPFAQQGEVEKSDLSLTEFWVEVWQSLVFVCLREPGDSVAERLSGLNWLFDLMQVQRFSCPQPEASEDWNADWKLAMENGMESYHLFKVHQKTLETVTPTKGAFYVRGEDCWTLTAGEMKMEQGWMSSLFSAEPDKIYQHYFLLMLPPNFIGILTYESLDWISVFPMSQRRCRVVASGLSDKVDQSKSTIDFVQQFFAEDKAICERVQRGMQSNIAKPGPLLDVERIISDFHKYLGRTLFEARNATKYTNPEAYQRLGIERE